MSHNYHLFHDGEDTTNYILETNRALRSTQNLDKFLTNVYNYFYGKGFYCIFFAKALNLITLLWIISLTTFLLTSINYKTLFETYNLSESVSYQGMHPFLVMCLIIVGVFWTWQFLQFLSETKENIEIQHFFNKQLHISESELQTIQWHEVVQRLSKVPRLLAIESHLSPLDIANRIMRKENYLISLINKEILNLEIPFPLSVPLQYIIQRDFANMNGRNTISIVTKTLEWGLSFTIFSYVFDSKQGVNKNILDPLKTEQLAIGLRKRFVVMGFIGLILSPFVFIFLLIYFLFKYGEEIRSRPGSFMARQWAPLAKWKFRELNELPHVFQKRLNKSYNIAEKYVQSFNFNLVTIFARFVSFVVGSVVVLFILIGIYDDDILFKLEVTQGKTALWYIGVGGTIIAVCRSLIPDENSAVDEPTDIMDDLVQYTHYMPKSWRGKAHTTKTLNEFTQLFQYKLVVFVLELLSVFFAPLILIFSLPNSAEQIIQFFRDFTTHEPGVGDICKFATFPLEEYGNKAYGVLDSKSSKKQRTKQGKMEKSFVNFKANHPDWQPPPQGEKYLLMVSGLVHSNTDSFNNNNQSFGANTSFGSSRMNTSSQHGGESAALNKIYQHLCQSNLNTNFDVDV